jgi:hypothetical protein
MKIVPIKREVLLRVGPMMPSIKSNKLLDRHLEDIGERRFRLGNQPLLRAADLFPTNKVAAGAGKNDDAGVTTWML